MSAELSYKCLKIASSNYLEDIPTNWVSFSSGEKLEYIENKKSGNTQDFDNSDIFESINDLNDSLVELLENVLSITFDSPSPYFLVTVRIVQGGVDHMSKALINAELMSEASVLAVERFAHSDLEWKGHYAVDHESGLTLSVCNIQEVLPEHAGILKMYL
ncbi:MAG: hypothetical protein QM500_19840 [Methylococcales bacterium]